MRFPDESAVAAGIEAFGPAAVALLDVSQFVFNKELRAYCEANRCGHFNRSWTCPPGVGGAVELIAEAASFPRAAVFQTVGKLKDAIDWKGTVAAGKVFNSIAFRINEEIRPELGRSLLLGAGHCQVCDRCAFRSSEPCRHPEKSVRSLEAYCVNVKELSDACGLKYTNGQDTVTFFGALLFDLGA
jgi:predicted metal-binding protein